jgi:ribonuclease P protein component
VLPKTNRIILEKEIKLVYRTKFRDKTSLFQTYLSSNSNPNFKLLVVISKKVLRRANKRNRLRRKIQSIFSKLDYQQRLPNNLSCILQVKSPKLLQLGLTEMENEILPSVRKLFQNLASKTK